MRSGRGRLSICGLGPGRGFRGRQTDLIIAKILDQWFEGICHMLRGVRIDDEQSDLRL